MSEEVCPRCNGTGRFQTTRRKGGSGRFLFSKCDCTYDDFGRRRPEKKTDGAA